MEPGEGSNCLWLTEDWGCVILREIDFLLKICWSIPCLHPSWKVHTIFDWVFKYNFSNINSYYCLTALVSGWQKNFFCALFLHGRRKGRAGEFPLGFWNLTFSCWNFGKKGCFLSFERVKRKFTTFGCPSGKNFLSASGKIHRCIPSWKKSFRPPCLLVWFLLELQELLSGKCDNFQNKVGT